MKALSVLSLLMVISFSTAVKAEMRGSTWGGSYKGAEAACEVARSSVLEDLAQDYKILSVADSCRDCQPKEDNETETICYIDYTFDWKN